MVFQSTGNVKEIDAKCGTWIGTMSLYYDNSMVERFVMFEFHIVFLGVINSRSNFMAAIAMTLDLLSDVCLVFNQKINLPQQNDARHFKLYFVSTKQNHNITFVVSKAMMS